MITRFDFDVAVARVTAELRAQQPFFNSSAAFGMCEMVNRHLFGNRLPEEKDEAWVAQVDAAAELEHTCPAGEVGDRKLGCTGMETSKTEEE